jgi:hypothetical protein
MAATFNGVYMRPNLASTGEVPAAGNLCVCPDIWVAGTSPVPNFKTALAASGSYATESGNNVAEYADNYVYLRARNGTQVAQTRTVQLYYASSGVIQWPSSWEPNVILTDVGGEYANIANLVPGVVGVGDQTFVWRNVQPPPTGNHFCLIAQVNDAQNDNPAPQVDTLLDMGELLRSNLGFGMKNTQLVSANQPAFEFSTNLTIAGNMPVGQYYTISVAPVGWLGYEVSVTCSRTDEQGKQIVLIKTPITQDGAGLALPECPLEPGFNASLNIIVTAKGNVSAPKPGAKLPVSCHYTPGAHSVEGREAVKRGLVDWGFMHTLRRSPDNERIEPVVAISLGSYTWLIQ